MRSNDPGGGVREASHLSHDRRAVAWFAFISLLVLAVVATGVAWVLPQPVPPARIVTAPPSVVILAASDIPEIGWGVRATGTNGSAAWRLFAVHNELMVAWLNVTLWVVPNADSARAGMDAIARDVSHPTEDGGVQGSDGALFWSYGSGHYAGMIVRRYNVVFTLSASLENSFALTKSDLGVWAGWQLERIEALAS